MVHICFKDHQKVRKVVLVCKGCGVACHPRCRVFHKVLNKKGEMVLCTAGYTEIDQKEGTTQDFIETEDISTPMDSSDSTQQTTSGVTTPEVSNRDNTDNSCTRKRRRTDDDMDDNDALRAIIQKCMQQEVNPLINSIDDLKKEIIALKKTVTKLTNENSLLVNKSNVNTIVNVENGNNNNSPYVSYANVAKKKKAETVIVVKPVTDDAAPQGDPTKKVNKNDNLNSVKSSVNVRELGIGVKSIKEKSNGTIVLKLNNVNDKEKLQKKFSDNIGNQFKVQAPKAKKKFIKIVYIDNEESKLSDEQLVSGIVKQNNLKDYCEKIEMKIVKRIVNDKKSDFSVIAEVNPELQKVLLFIEKISLGWKQCKVVEHINVIRCFKCCGYNHYASECKRDLTCGKCGGAHSTKACEKTAVKCTNCAHKNKKKNNDKVDDKHSAFDKKCPIYIKIADSYKKRESENI